MAVPFQPNRFEPIGMYDSPGAVVDMLFDNEFTARGIRQALFSPEALTPKERDGIRARMKRATGDHAVSNAFIDILTNPLTYLMFLSAPAASGANVVGKRLHGLDRELGAFVKKNPAMTHALQTATELTDGTPIGGALHDVTQGIHKLHLEEVDDWQIPTRDFLKANGLTTMSLTNAPMKERAKLQEIHAAYWARRQQLHQERVIPTSQLAMDTKTGKWVHVRVEDRVQPQWITNPEAVEAIFKRYPGLQELMEKHDAFYRKRYAALFLDAKGNVDPKKVYNLWDGSGALKDPAKMGPKWIQSMSVEEAVEGMDILQQLHGPWVRDAIREGNLKADEFYDLVKALHETSIDQATYIPKNLPYFHNPEKLTPQQIVQSPWGRPAGATVPLTSTPPLIHPNQLMLLRRFGATPALEASIKASQAALNGDKFQVLQQIDPFESLARYSRRTRTEWALHIQQPSEGTRRMVDPLDADLLDEPALGSHSVFRFLQGAHAKMQNTTAADALKNAWLPAVTHSLVNHHTMMYAAVAKSRTAMGSLAGTKFFQSLKASGGFASQFVEHLERIAAQETTMKSGSSMAQAMAKWIYGAHLGLNIGSTLLNLTQPFLLAGTQLGYNNLLRGYKGALEDYGAYVGERMRLGWRASAEPLLHEQILRRTFRHTNWAGEDLLKISAKPFELLDSMMLHGTQEGRFDKLFDVIMAPFQHAEMFNRAAVAHATEAAATARQLTDPIEVGADIRRMISSTQFSGGPESTPQLFMGGGDGAAAFFANPTIRQFQSFPTRSFIGATVGPGRVAEGVRYLRGTDKELPGPAWLWDALRGAGFSAMVYEAGKNLVGGDPLKGGYIGAANPLGNRFLTSDNPLPVPPVIQIPLDLIRALLGDDTELWRATLPRTLPGGVAISKAMGILPNMEGSILNLGGLPSSLQKTYVGWSTPSPDGYVPVFKGDGSLVDYQSKASLVFRGLGVDLDNHKEAADIDGFLSKNRQEILQYRQQAMAAMLSNDIPKVRAVQAEYQRRFGLPLTISQVQLKAALRQRNVPRSERMLDGLPADARQSYANIVGADPRRLGVTKELWDQATTSAARTKAGGRRDTTQLDPATLRELRDMLQEKQRTSKAREGAFKPFLAS